MLALFAVLNRRCLKASSMGFPNTLWEVCTTGKVFRLIYTLGLQVCVWRGLGEELNCYHSQIMTNYLLYSNKKEKKEDRVGCGRKSMKGIMKEENAGCSKVESKTQKICTSSLTL